VIVGTERHEARRIDRQLRGRSGRQGDPGQSVFYLSLEDDLMRLFGSERIARWMDRGGAEEGEVITHPLVTGAISQAQKRVELQNFQARKRLLEYDDVMNQQREVMYSLRLFALEGGEELKAEARRMIDAAVGRLIDSQLAEYKDAADWDRELVATELLQKYLISAPDIADPAKVRTQAEMVRAAQEAGRAAFDGKLAYFKEIEPKVGAVRLGEQALAHIMLTVIDEKWKDHLYDLDQLKAGIQFRTYGQKDPLIEYKQEAFEMFQGLIEDLRNTFTERWLKLRIELGPPPGGTTGPAGGRPRPAGAITPGAIGGAPRRPAPMVALKPDADGLVSQGTSTGPRPQPGSPPGVGAAVANPYAGIGRNDPCPCGSGKKYKKCHGAAA
jgi:preprotein translocase subunit SecA